MIFAFQNLVFRGHEEKFDSQNRGNFLAIIIVLVKYNPILSDII